MTTETMNMHKALAEINILGARIENATANNFIDINKHSNQKIAGLTIHDYEEVLKGNWNQWFDFVNRWVALKKAVTASNAVTKVLVNGIEYTVAEAIAMKTVGMEHKSLMLRTLKNQYNNAQAKLNRANGDDLTQKAENYVTGLYGSKDKTPDPDQFEKVKAEYIKQNSLDLIDPNKILDKINALEKEISEFNAEIDSALSVSNANTLITIEY